MNISLEMSDGWIRMVLFQLMRLSRVGLSMVLKIALLPFLGFWLISFRNLVIDFFVHICECLEMRARTCFWAFVLIFPSSVIQSSSGGLVGGLV